jgi:regulator of nucleoside diphosphate kinase
MTIPHLTSKDFTILEAMRDRCLSPASAYGRLLARKIDTARVVLTEDIAPDRVTLNTRLRYSVGGGAEIACLLVQGDVHGIVGLTLPVETMRGLALLGLRPGEQIELAAEGGPPETLAVVQVDYQPEAARRERRAGLGRPAAPALRLVHSVPGVQGARSAGGPPQHCAALPWPDDPGPSAA